MKIESYIVIALIGAGIGALMNGTPGAVVGAILSIALVVALFGACYVYGYYRTMWQHRHEILAQRRHDWAEKQRNQ